MPTPTFMRWNPSTHYLEVSSDNGGTWTPMDAKLATLTIDAGVNVNPTGIVTSSFVNALNVGTWDAVGYAASPGNRLDIGGYRSSQWTALGLWAGGNKAITIFSSGSVDIGGAGDSGAPGLGVNGPVVFSSMNVSGISLFGSSIKLKSYSVAGLPAGVPGYLAYITDALAPTFGAIAVGGGAISIPVFYNGTNWITV